VNFLAELKRRNVIRMAGLYLVGAWLIVQVAETILPVFGVPDWVLRAIVIVLALGFLPALVFSWVYELTPDGLKRDAEVDPARSIAPQTAHRMDLLTLAGVLILLLVIAADRWWPSQPATTADVTTATTPGLALDTSSPPEPSESEPAERSVAVLPFVNMSADPEQEYFSDGMTEELLNVLAKIPGLKVAARTSVFAFKGKGGDVREIGARLGVSHLVEGSVRRDGDAIRVTAQLIRVEDGFHVWSETYDRKLENVFALQDDLAKRVGSALQESLYLVAPVARSAIDPAAYDHYLKGRALLRARRDIATAITEFQAAVALEPGFAAGWSSLSLSYDVGYWYIENLTLDDRNALIVQQAAAAERAAAIEPDSAAVNHALGNVARKQFRYAESKRRYLRAMQIDPGYPDVREDHAELLYQVGRIEDSMLSAQQLVELDPFFGIGWVRIYDVSVQLDRRSEVEAALDRIRALMPDGSFAKFGMLDYALTWGRADEARAALADVLAQWPEEGRYAEILLPWALRELELDADTLREALAQAPTGEPLNYIVARRDVALYDAFMVENGATSQGFYFSYLNSSPGNGQIMLRDPRVKANLLRYGFVDYWREQGWPPRCRPLGDTDFECGIDAQGAR
jgi:TolB-like protein/DNA-binding SARP family transcriptional activator